MQIHRTKLRHVALALAASVLLPASVAIAQMELIVDLVVNGGNSYNWQRVALPGTICGNGSQYKFWYYDSPTSNNMVVMFEGGGACWDYDTCSGRAGVLGASNPNGLPDNYIDGMAARYVSPIVNGADPGLPFRAKRNIATNGWDMVYMPYCTGDVHTGNSVATYVDQTGANPPIVWHHAGHYNTIAAANFLRSRFPSVGKLLVTGFSAGGVGTATNYYTLRRTLLPTRGYSLNDSGPLFPAANSSAKSWALHRTIEAAWGLATIYSEFPASFNPANFGSATTVLATEFAWAERMLDRTRARAAATTGSLTATRTGQAALSVSAIALITGGGAVAAVVDRYRTIGITTLVAGLCALAILVPSVQRWINRPSAAPSDRGNAPVPGDGTRPGATHPHPTKGLPT